jgi:hypothetical protein
MWPFKKSKPCPKEVSTEDFSGECPRLQELGEAFEQLLKDQAVLNTAINRIERKQNRWLEVINAGDGKKSQELPKELEAILSQANTPQPQNERTIRPGDELEEYDWEVSSNE